ncbi:MAG: hypothetical protein MZV64_61525 [Ignavibacteriales bacterium]|nr:hypothetical protein [Ignavibacteriales bacterium]
MDSEGLLLLSNDKLLVDHLLNPNNFHEKEYLAQVEGVPTEEEMNKFRKGLLIENKITLPAKIEVVVPRNIPERVPPIRIRMNIHCVLVKNCYYGRKKQASKKNDCCYRAPHFKINKN